MELLQLKMDNANPNSILNSHNKPGFDEQLSM